jgi:hypothetical protein
MALQDISLYFKNGQLVSDSAVTFSNALVRSPGMLTIYRQAASGVTPSATINTNGSAVTISADSGFTGFLVTGVTAVSTGLATETITINSVTTYSDNSTNSQSGITSVTLNATTGFGLGPIVGMLLGSDSRTVKTLAFTVKSSIASSAASLTFNVIGINLP